MNGGVYKITNDVNNKVYIGRTKNFNRRFSQYKSAFQDRSVRHINEYLLKSMIKHGFEKFKFEILEICSFEKQPERELYWMIHYNSLDREFGYNLRLDTDESLVIDQRTRDKISARLKVEWETGIRKDHGLKLKESWLMRDKLAQSDTMTKALTKWVYVVYKYDDSDITVHYKELKSMKLHGVLGKFAETKSNKVTFKGFVIERIRYES